MGWEKQVKAYNFVNIIYQNPQNFLQIGHILVVVDQLFCL